MAGTSNISGQESVIFADNVSFDGTERGGRVTTNGQLLIGSTATPHIRVGTLSSSDSSIIITNGAGTIDLKSNPAVVQDLHVAKWIVNPTPNAGGNQTTISAAITAASSGDTIFITPGTYTENLTLKSGVNLTAFVGDSQTPTVTIVGKLSYASAGTVSVSNIRLQTNGDFVLAVSGTAASVVNLNYCDINCTNNTGISFTTANANSQVSLVNCTGNLSTTGIAFFSKSSTGAIIIDYSRLINGGLSTTANTISAGIFTSNFSIFANPLTSSGTTAVIGLKDCLIKCDSINSTAFTHGSTSATPSAIEFCTFASGTASAISVSAGATLNIHNCDIGSSNTNAITGAGVINYSELCFISTSSTVNTTTQTASFLRYGKLQSTLQPCFLATAGNQANVTGDGTAYTATFTTVAFDQDSNFNGTTTFTAPLTGKYLLGVIMELSGLAAGNTTGSINIVTTARSYGIFSGNVGAMRNAGNALNICGTCIANMTAGDTALVTVIVSGGAKVVSVSANSTARFYGNLIC